MASDSISVCPITHISPHLDSLGGMQAVVRHHLAHDAQVGLEARQIVLFEQPKHTQPGVDRMGWNWRSTIYGMRRAYQTLMSQWPGRVCLYHNLWGVPFLADLDRASRRLGYLHSFTPRLEAELRAQRGLVDGLIAVSPAQCDLAVRCLPELGADRIRLLPLPIDPPSTGFQQSAMANRPIVLGYSGRLVKSVKRVDRLPELVRELDKRGVNFRLELLGDGPDAGWLKEQFKLHPAVKFHGAQTGEAYWKILSHWDAILYVSDSEGTPVSLLEGLSVGVMPLFPRLPSGGTAYAQQVDPAFLYEPGEMAQAAQIIQDLVQQPGVQWAQWRERGLRAVQGHLGESYLKAFRGFLEELHHLPRISTHNDSPRPGHLADFVPLGVVSRWWCDALLKR